MAFSQKYGLVSFLSPIDTGAQFTMESWPLHVSICDVFALNWTPELKEELQSMIASTPLINTKVIGEEWFGSEQDVHVALVEKTSDLDTLHRKFVQMMNEHAGAANSPQYTLDGYRPHISLHQEIDQTQPILLSNVSLIDMFPDNDPYERKVLETIKLHQS